MSNLKLAMILALITGTLTAIGVVLLCSHDYNPKEQYVVPNTSYELVLADDSIYIYDHDRLVLTADTTGHIAKMLLKDNE